jgi:DNA-binding response OmpR family regulator
MSGDAHIVVVDDEEDLRESIATYLRLQGFRISEAANGAALDSLLAGERVDVVLLDVNMPGEDGFSIARRLAGAGGPAIIMLTAKQELVDRVVGLELGADDYITKPFELREVLARVRVVLRRQTKSSPAAVSEQDLSLTESLVGAPIGEPAWTLRLLDGGRLEGAKGEVALGARKALGLLAYLALQDTRMARRETLANLLWQDVDPAQARSSLRQTLTAIRRIDAGQPSLVTADNDFVRLGAQVACDAWQFTRWARGGSEERRRAADLYKVDLLAGFDLRGVAAFEDWLGVEQSRLRHTAVGLFAGMIEDALEPSGDLNAGLAAALKLLMLDPFNEAGHRGLMSIYALQGRSALALRQYRQLCDLLQRELQVSPDAETQALNDRLKAARRRLGSASPRLFPPPAPR